ncbi:MAG: hypothetical protein WD696_10345 [Bryobacteraceae bacterium]
MDQNTVVRKLRQWLCENKWHPSLAILHDLASWGLSGESEQSALYLGEKKRGLGHASRICLPDILVRREDTRSVDLIVEVDLNAELRPKDLVGLLLTPALAENHTPSYRYGVRSQYLLRDTVVIAVTALTAVERGQDVAEAMYRKFHLSELGIRGLCVCL